MDNFCHPGYQIVLEYEIYGRQDHRTKDDHGMILLKAETREVTVAQARVVQCMKCNKMYQLAPQLRTNRG